MEKTLILVKPLGLQNCLLEIMGAVRAVGTITCRQLIPVSRDLIAAHYKEHEGRDFFPRLLDYYEGETVLALVVEGPDVIARVRALVGPADPRKAAPGQIRHLVMTRWRDGESGWRVLELITSGVDNFVHASDSPEAAAREIALWLPEASGE